MTARRRAKVNPKGLNKEIVQTQRLVAKSVNIVHQFARELRPTALDDLGLIATLHSHLKAFMKQTGIRVHFTTFTSGRIDELDNAIRTVFYRVTQEALANVAQHAEASQVTVTLGRLSDAVRLTITDNGKSFQVNRVLHAGRSRRLGLVGMRERVEMVGGTFSIASARGKGTTVQAQIPLGKATGGRRRAESR